MEITKARLPDDADEIVDFVVARTPPKDRAIVRSDVDPAARLLGVLVARERNGAQAGVGVGRAASNLPEGTAFVIVCTRADLGGKGLGSRLYGAVLADLDNEVTRLVACVLEGDQTSLDVARQWSFRLKQRSVTSSLAVTGAVPPEPSGGVTFESCDRLVFDDADADGDQMHVVYTGVDPTLRGRALGRSTKEFLHAHARDLGIRMALTDNEESNAGIRHVNEQLGYACHSAWHWLMRPRP